MIGTLKPAVTVAAAQAEMDLITARLRQEHPQEYPPNGGLTFSIVPLLEQVVGNVRATLAVLLASVGIVLLVACTNVANLLLSRALAREREMAVRTAMGASRLRIVRQLLTESVGLALLGGAAGVAVASVSVRAIQWLQPPGIPRLRDIAVDGQMLLFTLILCVASGLLFGLAPAMGVGRLNLYGTLKDAGEDRPEPRAAIAFAGCSSPPSSRCRSSCSWPPACSCAASIACNAWLPGSIRTAC